MFNNPRVLKIQGDMGTFDSRLLTDKLPGSPNFIQLWINVYETILFEWK